MKIIPAILTDNESELDRLVLDSDGKVDRIQIDIIDGVFANNKTIDPSILAKLNTNLNIDFHLMVKDPVSWIDKCGEKPGNRLIGQIEMMESQKEFVEEVKRKNMLVGLALDLSTLVDKLDQEVISKVDVILLMSVEAGWAGQEFNLDVWDKIGKVESLRRKLNLKFKICVDGGVTKELIQDMEKSGVDEVAIGKRIFEPDLKENLSLLYE